jgi:hypothetical protein
VNTKLIISQLLGGLGNQMFQYAAGKSLALRYGLELKVDTSILEDHAAGRHAVNRNYDLDLFTLKVAKATSVERFRYNSHGLPVTTKLLRKALAGFSDSRILSDDTMGRDLFLAGVSPPPAYLAGTWQSYRYFEKIESVLRNDFSFKTPLLEVSRSLKERLSAPVSVCLHVRRTDYVDVKSSSDVLGFIGLEYYQLAVERMRNEVGENLSFFIFSDDIQWCRTHLSWISSRAEFVDNSHAGHKNGNYLALMSCANNFIIPNSTFSWWAAWLATGSKKKVILPKRWFKDDTLDSSGLCLPDWIRL